MYTVPTGVSEMQETATDRPLEKLICQKIIRVGCHLVRGLSWGAGKEGARWGASTFARQPPRLCAEADAPAILVIIWRPAEVIPGTLGTDTAQVRTVCFDAFVNSLLLEKNQRVRVPSVNSCGYCPWPSYHASSISPCRC